MDLPPHLLLEQVDYSLDPTSEETYILLDLTANAAVYYYINPAHANFLGNQNYQVVFGAGFDSGLV